ncbi:thiolase family protein [Lampropedia aestuarii]|uniref:propanoyl-CoA C-acyltransferase n=1 Tax=Lampropedia aestuarii TaxID=2562762 RepID=A0A4S5BP66_9BURK|nr:thiolase family protein [Lampropedia aestuarii]MDH5858443.1 thiolase family protein [Lampropedia aestuarii]THJ31386.1 thiolase family protein [Lampropedia aestuarii]
MSSVYIVGVGMTPLGRHLSRSVKDLTRQAVQAALQDAGCGMQAIESAWFSNTRQGVLQGQHGIRGQCALRAMGFEAIPIINCDNACASSSTGLNQAWAAIKAGVCEVALVVGAEKMHLPERRDLMFEAFWGGMDRELAETQLAAQAALSAALPLPPEANLDAGERSVFMDSYAAMARHHMMLHGTTQRQLAIVASKNHSHAQHNPMAQYQHPCSVEEVLADRLVSWPLTRAMCAPMSDGAGALILCSQAALKRFDKTRAVRVLATQLASGVVRDPADFSRHIGRLAALKAYEQAGVSPDDVDVAEVHDASSFAEIRHIENLGLCEIGAGGAMAERGETRVGGRMPVNPSGGLVSKGHPIAATGAIQILELVTQLRGEAGGRQVAGARIAAAENGGGFYAGEEAVAAVTILERA